MERDGRLDNPSNGLLVRGWMADTLGNISTNTPVTNIQLPVGQSIAPLATTSVEFGGKLHPAINGELKYPALTVTEAGGQTATIEFTVTEIGFNQYHVVAASNTATLVPAFATDITLNATGNVANSTVMATFDVDLGGGNLVTVTPPTNFGLPANGGTFSVTSAGDTGGPSQGLFHAVQPLVTTTRVYDSLGIDHTITTTVTKTGINNWSWSSVNELGNAIGNGTLAFSNTGQLLASTGGPLTWTPLGAQPLSITPDFSKISQNAETPLITKYICPTEINSPSQNGYPSGTLQGFNIGKSGIIDGVFSNGVNQALAQIAMANFTNPGGLIRSGDTMFEESNNSGPAQVGAAGKNGRGLVTPGTIEMSNVDLSEQFTDMIVTERGFQANSKIITTSDEMLQELVNLKR